MGRDRVTVAVNLIQEPQKILKTKKCLHTVRMFLSIFLWFP